MENIGGPALLFRKTDYGDADLILALFTLNHGKVSVMAKSAKNSRKRFGGMLELFSLLDVTTGGGRAKGMPLLTEARLLNACGGLRGDFRKTAYAAYWCDLVTNFVEDGVPEPDLFKLLCFFLDALAVDAHDHAFLNIVFQAKLAQITGLAPNLKQCFSCGREVFIDNPYHVIINIAGGGAACGNCLAEEAHSLVKIAAGTVKQMIWVAEKPLDMALRAHFSESSLKECQLFWENFLAYHFDKVPKSLNFLRQIR